MKILFFIDKLYGGGAERIATVLMNHLCQQHNVIATVFSQKKDSFFINSNISIHKISTKQKIKFIRPFERILKIKKEIEQNNPDLIISFLTHTNIYALIANLLTKKRIIVSERNTLNRQCCFVRLLRKILYPTADRIVFVTNIDCKNFGLSQKSLTIYNPSLFNSYTDYCNRQKKIITIAPTSRWYNKGIDILLKAWAKISYHNPDWELEIMGDFNTNDLPSKLQNMTGQALWLGWKSNVSEVLRTKSIFILASRFEGCPNSLIEAMSQGCACIGTNCEGGINEIITNGQSGLLAKNGDIDDLAAKMQLLIDDEHLRQKLSAGAIEEVKRFDNDLIMNQWDELIQVTMES